MKKQLKKLSLDKRTISNLLSPEIHKHIGGLATKGRNCYTVNCTVFQLTACCTVQTCNTCQGHTCNGNNC